MSSQSTVSLSALHKHLKSLIKNKSFDAKKVLEILEYTFLDNKFRKHFKNLNLIGKCYLNLFYVTIFCIAIFYKLSVAFLVYIILCLMYYYKINLNFMACAKKFKVD